MAPARGATAAAAPALDNRRARPPWPASVAGAIERAQFLVERDAAETRAAEGRLAATFLASLKPRLAHTADAIRVAWKTCAATCPRGTAHPSSAAIAELDSPDAALSRTSATGTDRRCPIRVDRMVAAATWWMPPMAQRQARLEGRDVHVDARRRPSKGKSIPRLASVASRTC
jgi:hypothetical protein